MLENQKAKIFGRITMIKLTVHPDTQPLIYNFDAFPITIGAGGDLDLPEENLQEVHLKLLEQNNRFVVINHANDPFVTLNGQPFGKKTLHNKDLIVVGKTKVLFEMAPAAPLENKKAAQSTEAEPSLLPSSGEQLNAILDKALIAKAAELRHPQRGAIAEKILKKEAAENFEDFDFEAELEKLEEIGEKEDLSEFDLEELLQQVEGLDTEKIGDPLLPFAEPLPSLKTTPSYKDPGHYSHESANSFSSPLPLMASPESTIEKDSSPSTANFRREKNSLKDYYLSELDDDNEGKGIKQKREDSKEKNSWNWKLIGIISLGIVAILALAFALLYHGMSGKNTEEELKAAAGVADVAMALTHAQMSHSAPPNQNWSDPEFIKNHLLSVLASPYLPVESLDTHGQFTSNSYMIRIYTSADLSQYVVIAQPTPSLMHWLIPKASIILNSTNMEMRRINDLKALNRLLLSPGSLDGFHVAEINQLVNHGELISLSTVAAEMEKQGFLPPKYLAMIRPGAENLIYNAPRYYQFGEKFLKNALALTDNQTSSHDLEVFQHETKALSKFPNIVLYSSLGIQWASQAQKAFNVYFPQNKFLIAYLKFNSKGLISNSQLLIDSPEVNEIAEAAAPALSGKNETPATSPAASFPYSQHSSIQQNLQDSGTPAQADKGKSDLGHSDPLFAQLCAIETAYQKALQPHQKELVELFKVTNQNDIIEFLGRLEVLLQKGAKTYPKDSKNYEKTVSSLEFVEKLRQLMQAQKEQLNQEKQTMARSLLQLYSENSNVPLEHFMGYVKAANLEPFVQEILSLNEEQLSQKALQKRQIEEQIKKIRSAKNLQELQKQVDLIAHMLQLEKLPDPKQVIAFQGEVKLQVIEKLNAFLLSNENVLPKEDFTDSNRSILAHILKTAWVSDPDEFDFYLSEFEVRSKQTEE